jgi:hypothetical protein
LFLLLFFSEEMAEGGKKTSDLSYEEHVDKYCPFAIQNLKLDPDAKKNLQVSALRFYDTQSSHFLENEGKAIPEEFIRNLILKTLKTDCLRVADDIMNEVLGKRVGVRARSLISDESMFDLMRSSILVDYGMNKAFFVLEKDKVAEPTNFSTESEKCKIDPTIDECANCAAKECTVNLRMCARCKKVKYCSTACQTQHWKQGGHKRFCVAEGAERIPSAVFPNRGKCPVCTEDMTTHLMMLQCGCFLHIECLRKSKTKLCEKCTA